MDKAQARTRGGDADMHRKPGKIEPSRDRKVDKEVEETFPASDPPASTQPVGKEPPPPKPQKSH